MYRCLVAFLDEYGFLIYKRPLRISFRVVLQSKGLLYTVFLVYQGRFIDIRLRVFRNLHESRDVVAYLIGTEIHRRQVGVAIAHDAGYGTKTQQGDA